jgi:hypothetical protein
MELHVKRLLNLWNGNFYLEVLTIIISLVFYFYTLFIRNRSILRSTVSVYFISIFILFFFTAWIILIADTVHIALKYIEILNMLFNGIEIYVCYIFFAEIKLPITELKTTKLVFSLLIGFFLILSILFFTSNVENYTNHYRPVLKIGETVDVLKRCIICIPCFYYFLRIFKLNLSLQLNEVMVVYAIFCYCVFGILAYSLGANISDYRKVKNLIMAVPTLSLWLLCVRFIIYLKNNEI